MEWTKKKKVFLIVAGVIIVLAIVGWATGWWSSEVPPVS